MSEVWVTREGEFYPHVNGKIHKRLPAGGHGGGLTSYVDQVATDSERLAYLRYMADTKAAEADLLLKQHGDAEAEIAEKREAEAAKAAEQPIEEPVAEKSAEAIA